MKYKDILTEGDPYQDRVNDVARGVRSTMSQDPTHDVKNVIASHSYGQIEHRLGGKAKTDFHRDVHNAVKSDVNKMASDHRRASSAANIGQFHQRLADVINDGVGNSVPDGDPIDHIHPKAIRLANEHGIKDHDGYPVNRHSDISHHLDKASKLNGFKNYGHQLQSTWQDYHENGYEDAKRSGDAHAMEYHDQERKNNPWGNN